MRYAIKLKGIFNGFYRSGTTLFYKILSRSNKDSIILYEPLHPNLKKAILIGAGKDIHNENVYRGYTKLKYLEEYLKFHEQLKNQYLKHRFEDIIPIEYKEIKKLVNILNKEDKNIILQTNRFHFILKDFIERDIPAIHIIRNPIDIYFSMVITNKDRKKSKLLNWVYSNRKNPIIRKFLLSIPNKMRIFEERFWVYQDFNIIKKYFNLNYGLNLDFISKLLIVWTYINYYAYEQIGKNRIIYYEDLILKPEKVSKKIKKVTNCEFDPSLVNIRRSQITYDSNLIEFFIKRLKELNLLNKVEKFFDFESIMVRNDEKG